MFWLGLAVLARAGEFQARDPCGATRSWSGCLTMFAFFRISAHLMDQRMLKNRGPAYKTVMREVGGLIPFLP